MMKKRSKAVGVTNDLLIASSGSTTLQRHLKDVSFLLLVSTLSVFIPICPIDRLRCSLGCSDSTIRSNLDFARYMETSCIQFQVSTMHTECSYFLRF